MIKISLSHLCDCVRWGGGGWEVASHAAIHCANEKTYYEFQKGIGTYNQGSKNGYFYKLVWNPLVNLFDFPLHSLPSVGGWDSPPAEGQGSCSCCYLGMRNHTTRLLGSYNQSSRKQQLRESTTYTFSTLSIGVNKQSCI